MASEQIVDITIIGGGPTGLAAAYYGGHRDASVRIVESLEQLGGQVSAVYPEKHIFDVAGYPKINGQELIDRLTDQAMQYEPEVRLGEVIETVSHRADAIIELRTATGETLLTRTMIITAGHGAFNPRKLDLPDLDRWEGNGLHYFVKRKEAFAGRRVALVGGGDSALDWALGLQDTAQAPITLIHRRERFRGLESSVNEVHRLADEGRVQILVPCARVRVPPGADRRLGPRVREQAPDPRQPDLRDEPGGRVRGRRRGRLRRQDHADHGGVRGGGAGGEPRGRPHPRREGAAQVLHGVVEMCNRECPFSHLHLWVGATGSGLATRFVRRPR